MGRSPTAPIVRCVLGHPTESGDKAQEQASAGAKRRSRLVTFGEDDADDCGEDAEADEENREAEEERKARDGVALRRKQVWNEEEEHDETEQCGEAHVEARVVRLQEVCYQADSLKDNTREYVVPQIEPGLTTQTQSKENVIMKARLGHVALVTSPYTLVADDVPLRIGDVAL